MSSDLYGPAGLTIATIATAELALLGTSYTYYRGNPSENLLETGQEIYEEALGKNASTLAISTFASPVEYGKKAADLDSAIEQYGLEEVTGHSNNWEFIRSLL